MALSTSGVVYTHTTVHVSPHDWLPAPYTVGFVDLDDDVRVLTHLTGEPRIGANAHLTEIAFDDRRIYGFQIEAPEGQEDG